EPSSGHGVTTIVTGNCGVGFAPVRPGTEAWLIQLMEGVEDIPGTALAEGMTWDWETFPEYLDVLARRRFAIDVGSQVAHGAVRAYVMGERGAKNEPATPEDIAAMAEIVREAIAAGAFGFSTSRTLGHRAMDGEPVPGTFAAEDELFGLGRAVRDGGGGVFELAPAGAAGEDIVAPHKEVAWMKRLAAETGIPVSFALLQVDAAPRLYEELMDESLDALNEGVRLVPQVAARPFGILIGFGTNHPFAGRPTYRRLASTLSPDELARALTEPEHRAAILAEQDVPGTRGGLGGTVLHALERVFILGDPPDYEPTPERSIASMARASGEDPAAVLYDRMSERDGRGLLMLPFFSYSDGNHEAIREMLTHPAGVSGLGDGGAHCGVICDASMPTYLLTHWARDRARGPRLELEWVVRKQTKDTAELYGFSDRGTITLGKRADLNIIDFDRLRLDQPEVVYDLPAGGRRLIQHAAGYTATIVGGAITRRDGADTGARPGRLVRRGG
ncbi:MAG TPA: amidohydrolase family protein, partial [Acidimicrobiales bacterium]|nr:amidohydrolase family protein [Acidimicrobiales bacterium]